MPTGSVRNPPTGKNAAPQNRSVEDAWIITRRDGRWGYQGARFETVLWSGLRVGPLMQLVVLGQRG